jgi:hypothetical protein
VGGGFLNAGVGVFELGAAEDVAAAMTRPIWQPLSAACLIWRAMCMTSSMPMPRSPPWLKLSPDSLRMTRA